MGRLIDVENIDYVKLEDSLHCLEHHKGDEVECVICAPIVEAIPKAEVRKLLRDNADKVSDSILDIVREDYIHKTDYEARLKADMVAMLTDLQLDIEEIEIDNNVPSGFASVSKTSAFYEGVSASSKVIQEKINALKGGTDGKEDS